MKLKKVLIVLAMLVIVPAFLFVGCGHEHAFGEELKFNETHHWFECECGEKKDEAEHTFNKQVQTSAYLKASTDTQNIYYKSCVCGAKASDTETFAIDKTIPTLEGVSMSSVTITYLDNYSVNYTTNSTGTAKIEYKAQGDGNEAYTTEQPTDAGDYTARVTILSNETYALVKSDPINFTIQKYTLSQLNTTVVYNGTNTHTIEFDEVAPGQFESGLSLDVSFNGTGVGASPTGAIPKLNGEITHNYTVDYATCIVSIVPKPIELSWQSNATPFIFDGTEKTPTVSLIGLVSGDECNAEITKSSGDNVWFDEEFSFEVLSLTGADYENYALPAITTSPTYEITISEVEVDEATFVDKLNYNIPGYFKISLESGYYAFKYDNATQDVEYSFEIMKKGETISIKDAIFDHNDTDEIAFKIDEAGDYYVKCTLIVDDEPQYDTLTIITHTHAELDEYGHCKHCGIYRGETENVNCQIDITFEGQDKLYYRFAKDDEDGIKQSILFTSGEFNYTAYGVSYAGTDYDPDTEKYNTAEEIELTDTLTEFAAYDYIYLVITQKGTTTSVTFQLQEATF